jgi:hypothetical protein
VLPMEIQRQCFTRRPKLQIWSARRNGKVRGKGAESGTCTSVHAMEWGKRGGAAERHLLLLMSVAALTPSATPKAGSMAPLHGRGGWNKK